MSFVRDNMAPLMFGGLIVFMLIGYPAAFSLAAVGLFFGFIGIELGLIGPDYLGNLTYQLYGIVSNDLLLAIPFFTFMGAILERCGLAEDLLDSIGQLFGPVRGGLSYAVIFVGAILGAITGTVAASVIAMGVISVPIMMRYGYSTRHTMGVIAASGTITQVIPPSLVLIVLADQLGRSVGEMYAGAIGPSLIQIALFCAWVFVVSLIWPKDVPALPPEARTLRGWALWRKCLRGIIPSLGLIFLVLGTIFMGLATPTEAGALGAVGALLLAAAQRTLTWPLVYQGMSTTMRLTAMVVYHPDRRPHLQPDLPGRRRQGMDRASADRASRRAVRLSRFREHPGVRDRVLPRFLRDRVHPDSAARARRGQARHRSRVVRGADLRQHPDELHASAVRIRAVLLARHHAAFGQDRGHLLGRDPVARSPAHPRRDSDHLARVGDLLAFQGAAGRSEHDQIRYPDAGVAAAAEPAMTRACGLHYPSVNRSSERRLDKRGRTRAPLYDASHNKADKMIHKRAPAYSAAISDS